MRMLGSHYKDRLRYHNGRREIFYSLLDLLSHVSQYGSKLLGVYLNRQSAAFGYNVTYNLLV